MMWPEKLSQMLFVFATTLFIIWFMRKFLKNRKSPPGPYGLPIVGYLPFATKKMYEVFIDLEQKYGKVISVPIGISRAIIINDASIARKILVHPAALARPQFFTKYFPGGGGLSGLNGKDWLEQRRFCANAMKNLGLGRGEWETILQDAAIEMVAEIRGWEGKPVNYMESLEFSQANNLLSLLVGKKLLTDRHSPDAVTVITYSDIFVEFVSAASLAANVPVFLTRLLAKLKIANLDVLINSVDGFEEILRREITNHIATRTADQKPNFIDYYMEESNKQKDDNHSFSENSLIGNIATLFLGGIDTTKATINWLLLLTAKYPDVQEKVHQEIREFAGKDRLIHWNERNNLPYTMATINEALRWVVTVPLFPPRIATADIKLGDYIIPKDSTIVVNNWRLLRGPGNSQEFNPERAFKNGNEKTENYLPFSIGKRNCPGELVAMMTIFLYYTHIVQNFHIACPQGKNIVLEDTGSMMVRHPIPQDLCFIEN